mmetsp:Transcript_12644/g.30108  ORF Transcript_12644/g.30108 Transcript_12644/m.30108 type:complete len:249 (-) Transcript_12644:185-931(-)
MTMRATPVKALARRPSSRSWMTSRNRAATARRTSCKRCCVRGHQHRVQQEKGKIRVAPKAKARLRERREPRVDSKQTKDSTHGPHPRLNVSVRRATRKVPKARAKQKVHRKKKISTLGRHRKHRKLERRCSKRRRKRTRRFGANGARLANQVLGSIRRRQRWTRRSCWRLSQHGRRQPRRRSWRSRRLLQNRCPRRRDHLLLLCPPWKRRMRMRCSGAPKAPPWLRRRAVPGQQPPALRLLLHAAPSR